MKKRYDKIFTYFKDNWFIVMPMCITALFFNGLMCLIPQIEGKTINSLSDGDKDKTFFYVIVLISLVLFVQVNRFLKRYLVRVFGNKMSFTMRKKSFDNLLHRDLSFFTTNNAGDILNRNLSDIYEVTEGIRKMTTEAFDTIVLLLGYLISMFIIDWQITLFVGAFVISSILVAHFMKRFVYKTNKDYKEYLSINKQITLSKLNNEIYYRGYGVSNEYYKDYEKSVDLLRKKNLASLIFQSTLEPLYSCIVVMGVMFIVYKGGINVIDGVYKIGTLSAYLTMFFLVSKKASRVGKVFNAYQGFKVSWIRCKDMLTNETKEANKIEMSDLTLRLKDFGYKYEGGFNLPKIDLECYKGDIVGVCGQVHTGKSTFLKALTGLYQYEGSATISGIEIAKISECDKQIVSYCAADVSMFSDTVENNIRLGREGDLKKALDVSKINCDLESIGGLDVLMSHSISNISGGQQKRVQMARALYPKTSLVLLDDPFQSVNKELAKQMIENLKEYKDEIIILVSNNPEIIKETNKIVYLEKQKAFIGLYEEVLNEKGFRNLMEVK